jgi:uncharacterized membrane protein YfcA
MTSLPERRSETKPAASAPGDAEGRAHASGLHHTGNPGSVPAPASAPAPVRALTGLVAALLALGLALVWFAAFSGDGAHTATSADATPAEDLFLYLVGVGAATIANATGVGGGVVFLPAFEFLSKGGHVAVSAAQIVGMSFVIQSFGMTVGSLRWLGHIFRNRVADTGVPPRAFLRLLMLVLACSLPALLATQQLHTSPPEAVLYAFKAVSIGLGLLLLVSTARAHGRVLDRTAPTRADYAALALLTLAGGAATAFFSVGTGELVALYLFVRRFPLVTTAAIAVMASAANVLVGVGAHLYAGGLPWGVLAFVIPGAVTGGYVARHVALMLGPVRLKLFAAGWITLSSGYLLWMH